MLVMCSNMEIMVLSYELYVAANKEEHVLRAGRVSDISKKQCTEWFYNNGAYQLSKDDISKI